MTEKKKEKVQLSLIKQIDNIVLRVGALPQYLMLPSFIKNTTKTVRDGRRYNSPVKFSYFNSLSGSSCAEICRRTMWDYGVPTLSTDLQWEVREWGKEDIIGLSAAFFVPHSQHWFADVIFRQNQEKYGYMVDHPPFYNESGIPSNKYSDRQYRPVGVMALPKTPDMFITQLIFGRTLGVSSRPKMKNKSIVKEDETFVKKIKKRKSTKQKTVISKQPKNKSKLGKTYS